MTIILTMEFMRFSAKPISISNNFYFFTT